MYTPIAVAQKLREAAGEIRNLKEENAILLQKVAGLENAPATAEVIDPQVALHKEAAQQDVGFGFRDEPLGFGSTVEKMPQFSSASDLSAEEQLDRLLMGESDSDYHD